MGELLSLLYDIWSILCGLVDALNSSDHFGLDYVVTMFPSSINDVLTNIDFTPIELYLGCRSFCKLLGDKM